VLAAAHSASESRCRRPELLHRPPQIEARQVCVDAHRRLDLHVTGERLGDPGVGVRRDEAADERDPQAVEVERPLAAVVGVEPLLAVVVGLDRREPGRPEVVLERAQAQEPGGGNTRSPGLAVLGQVGRKGRGEVAPKPRARKFARVLLPLGVGTSRRTVPLLATSRPGLDKHSIHPATLR
jgi:hypothetical protein